MAVVRIRKDAQGRYMHLNYSLPGYRIQAGEEVDILEESLIGHAQTVPGLEVDLPPAPASKAPKKSKSQLKREAVQAEVAVEVDVTTEVDVSDVPTVEEE